MDIENLFTSMDKGVVKCFPKFKGKTHWIQILELGGISSGHKDHLYQGDNIKPPLNEISAKFLFPCFIIFQIRSNVTFHVLLFSNFLPYPSKKISPAAGKNRRFSAIYTVYNQKNFRLRRAIFCGFEFYACLQSASTNA